MEILLWILGIVVALAVLVWVISVVVGLFFFKKTFDSVTTPWRSNRRG